MMLGPFCAFLGSLTWAVGSSYYKSLAEKHHPLEVGFIRALLALPILVIFVACISPSSIVPGISLIPSWNLGLLAASMFWSYFLGDSLFFTSTRYITLPEALSVASIYPIWTVIGGSFVEHSIPSMGEFFALIVVIIGLWLVVYEKYPKDLQTELSENSQKQRWLGVSLAFATSICWAFNALSVRYGSQNLDPWATSVARLSFAVVICGLGHIFLKKIPKNPFFLIGKKPWLYPIIVIEAVVGTFAFLYGLSRSPLVLGIVLSSLAPVLSVPIARVFFQQKISRRKFLGMILALAGTILAVKMGKT